MRLVNAMDLTSLPIKIMIRINSYQIPQRPYHISDDAFPGYIKRPVVRTISIWEQ